MGGDGIGGLFGISGGSGSAAVNVGGDVMDFFTIFVGYGGVVGGAGIGSQYYSVAVDEANDGGAGFEGFREFGGDGGGGFGGGFEKGVTMCEIEGEAGGGRCGSGSECEF